MKTLAMFFAFAVLALAAAQAGACPNSGSSIFANTTPVSGQTTSGGRSITR